MTKGMVPLTKLYPRARVRGHAGIGVPIGATGEPRPPRPPAPNPHDSSGRADRGPPHKARVTAPSDVTAKGALAPRRNGQCSFPEAGTRSSNGMTRGGEGLLVAEPPGHVGTHPGRARPPPAVACAVPQEQSGGLSRPATRSFPGRRRSSARPRSRPGLVTYS